MSVKRTLSSLLAAALAIATVAACGGSTSSSPTTASAPTAASAPATSSAPTTSEASTSAAGEAAATHTIVDSAGREVTLPVDVSRVVTLGSVPVINSFLFAVGKGDTIVSGLPPFAQDPRWKYQTVFAPQLVENPVVENEARETDVEAVLTLKPDVVFTMDPTQADPLATAGLNVVVLSWREAEDVKKVISLLGEVFGVPERAQAYGEVFDGTLQRVDERLEAIPVDQRPRALYLSLESLTQPHLIAEWWIAKAGGRSVTDNGRTEESFTFSAEQLLAWDPQVIFVPTRDEAQAVLDDPRFAGVAAVKDQRIYAVPIAAHIWSNRTSEQPLTVLWAATKLHPDIFADVDLNAELTTFYSEVYGVTLEPEQIREILDVL